MEVATFPESPDHDLPCLSLQELLVSSVALKRFEVHE